MANDNEVFRPTDADVDAFIAAAEPKGRREDALVVASIMGEVTGERPRMWGPSIVGYGRESYRYESGRQGEQPSLAFSPRRANLVLYGLQGPGTEALRERLGPHRAGVSCLWLGRLTAVDLDVLRELVQHAWDTRDEQENRGCR